MHKHLKTAYLFSIAKQKPVALTALLFLTVMFKNWGSSCFRFQFVVCIKKLLSVSKLIFDDDLNSRWGVPGIRLHSKTVPKKQTSQISPNFSVGLDYKQSVIILMIAENDRFHLIEELLQYCLILKYYYRATHQRGLCACQLQSEVAMRPSLAPKHWHKNEWKLMYFRPVQSIIFSSVIKTIF